MAVLLLLFSDHSDDSRDDRHEAANEYSGMKHYEDEMNV